MTIAVTNKKGFPSGGSCQCGKIALTDEGFVKFIYKRYFTPHPSRQAATPSPEGEGYSENNRNEITDGTYKENATVGHKAQLQKWRLV